MEIAIIVLGGMLVFVLGFYFGRKMLYGKLQSLFYDQEKKIQRLNGMYEMCSRWMLLKEKEMSISKFFFDNQIHSVAVYGMGRIGRTLVQDLIKDNVNVKYGIDVNNDRISCIIPVYGLKNTLPEVEMIVVTVAAYEQVKQDLKGLTSAKIISFEDLLKVELGE